MEERITLKNVCIMSILKIYNSKTSSEIIIDDSVDWVIITPVIGVEPKHFKIELRGFFFNRHIHECNDCRSFLEAFGSNKNDWFIKYNHTKYKIFMDTVGDGSYGGNEIRSKISGYEYGTTMVLSILQLNELELNAQLNNSVGNEDYESACLYRDLITEIKK